MASKDIGDIGPTSLSHIVGQQAVVEQLRIAIDAAFEDRIRLPHCLLVGPPGLGKTQTVSATSHELAVKCHTVLGQSIKSKGDIHALLMPVTDKEILFIDEVHGVPKPLQTLLYQAIDRRKISVICGSVMHTIPLENFTLMLATTDEHRLLQPLRDRMRLALHFQFYSVEELATIVRRVCQDVGLVHGGGYRRTHSQAVAGHSAAGATSARKLPSALPLLGRATYHGVTFGAAMCLGGTGRPWP